MFMAITGLILSLFVLAHMLGNLHFFVSPDAINGYAHFLQTLPPVILWGYRAVIGLTLIVHVTCAVSLAVDKARARPVPYQKQRFVRATFADTQMLLGGIVLFFFVLFHLANFTIHIAPQPFEEIPYTLQTPTGSIVVDDVYRMVVDNFQIWWLAALYIVAMGALCLHLAHGFSSMFQTLGLRNETWRRFLEICAVCYGVFLFVGFASLPISVLMGWKG